MILLIDNYDSFTWNLVHLLGAAGAEVTLHRNDALSVEAAMALGADGIVISPGPCDPARAGICVPLIRAAAQAGIPVLGVCLGHQAIGAAFGADVVRAVRAVHGKTDAIAHEGLGLFAGLPSPVVATRYHSLAVDPATLPDCLAVTARADDGTIMGLMHRTLPIEGVQFHPESIASTEGRAMIEAFLRRCTPRKPAATSPDGAVAGAPDGAVAA